MDISQDLITTCKTWLAITSSGWRTGVCQGKAIYLDGPEIGKRVADPHSACHSWVAYAFNRACFNITFYSNQWNTPYGKKASNILVLNCYSSKRNQGICSKQASDFLVLWLATESVFSKFILNRDDPKSLTEGGVILLCGPDGLTLAQTMWICKILRLTVEGGKAAETFMELVKGGVDPMLSLFIASHVRIKKGVTFGYTGQNGHSTVFYDINHQHEVSVFLQKKVNLEANSTSEVFVPKSQFLTSKTKVAKPAETIRSWFNNRPVSDGWGKTVMEDTLLADELIHHALDWQKLLTEKEAPNDSAE